MTLDAEGIAWQGEKPSLGTPKRLGPFQITKVEQERGNYEINLPMEMARIHPVFNVSKLERYEKPEEQGFEGRKAASGKEPITLVDGTEIYELEEIVDKRLVGKNKRVEYQCKWVGWPKERNTWVGWFPGDKSWELDQEAIAQWEAKGDSQVQGVKEKKRKKKKKKKKKEKEAVVLEMFEPTTWLPEEDLVTGEVPDIAPTTEERKEMEELHPDSLWDCAKKTRGSGREQKVELSTRVLRSETRKEVKIDFVGIEEGERRGDNMESRTDCKAVAESEVGENHALLSHK